MTGSPTTPRGRRRPQSERARVERLVERSGHAALDAADRDRLWPAQLAILAAIVLYITLPQKLTIGPNWLLPSLEGLLFVGLVTTMPRRDKPYTPWRRYFALALTGLASAANLASLVLLVHYLFRGGNAGGHRLILAGIVIWATNVLLFAVWYWELDRGGPMTRPLMPDARTDFLFPQMSDPKWAPADWHPRFVDYLYTSFTNSTAFSPTDTMPLTATAKTLMLVQSIAAFATVGLVVARAVNILS